MKNSKLVRSKLLPDLPTKFHFFSVAEVAIILGTSTKSVHEWLNQGLLRSFRIGPKSRLIRISYQDLEEFIDSHVRSGGIKLPEEDKIDLKNEQDDQDKRPLAKVTRVQGCRVKRSS